jgi:hypothetical protein
LGAHARRLDEALLPEVPVLLESILVIHRLFTGVETNVASSSVGGQDVDANE